ncbi:O-antigen ligase family protein [Candidatus Omnitrophota bacterium]
MKQAIILLLIFTAALYLGFNLHTMALSPVVLVAGIVVFFVTLVRTDIGLVILIFSMLLSPEIAIADMPERAVVIRVDDILIGVVFFTWLVKTALNKQMGFLKKTPLNAPMIAYILACLVSTTFGIMMGDVSAKKAMFYILKFVEYFMLYFMFVNNITSRRQIKIFLGAFLVTALIICILGSVQIAQGVYRPTAPFEGKHAEPNSLAGYLLIVLAVVLSIFLHIRSAGQKVILVGLFGLVFFVFMHTLSRSSYMAFFPMYFTLIIVSRKSKFLLLAVLTVAILFGPMVVPGKVRDRVVDTFLIGETVDVMGRAVTLEGSAAARIYHWQYGFRRWKESPLFGHGIVGIEFIDSQYFRVLGELGIVGLIIFFWVLSSVFRNCLWTYQSSQDALSQIVSLALLAALMGLLFQAIGVNTFIIVRVMEPFWFLAALVAVAPEVA